MLSNMLEAVQRFQTEIIGIDIPSIPTRLSPARRDFRINHIREEIAEMSGSFGDDTDEMREQADAFIDIVYIALGGLVEMGIIPGPVFDEVHAANMRKEQGEVSKRPNSLGFDAVKPEGWTGPDLAKAITAMSVLRHISDVHLEIAELRERKGQDYNSSVQLHDYFPLGHQSYFQMMHLKTKRAQSLIEVVQTGGTPNFEGLRDTLLDALNYITFWVEAIDEGKV